MMMDYVKGEYIIKYRKCILGGDWMCVWFQ